MSEQMITPLRGMPKWKVVNRDGTTPWTQAEVEKMFDMVARKKTNQQIADALGRTKHSVIAKLYNLTQQGVRYKRDVSGFSLEIIEKPANAKQAKPRLKCLCCRKMFESKDARKNRVCQDCKESDRWR